MRAIHRLLLILVFLSTATILSAQVSFTEAKLLNEKYDTLNKRYNNYEIVELDLDYMASMGNKQELFTLKVGEKIWPLVLEKNNLLSSDYKATKTLNNGEKAPLKTTVSIFKGKLDGLDKSSVRLVIASDYISGFFYDGKNKFYIEPIYPYLKDKNNERFVIYHAKDVKESLYRIEVEDNLYDKERINKIISKRIKSNPMKDNPILLNRTGTSTCYLELATETDFEYFQIYGANTNNHILSILNQAEQPYETTFNLEFIVTFQNYYETNNDPYITNSMTNTVRRDEFMAEWNNNFNFVHRDMAIMYSGKPMNGAGLVSTLGATCTDLSESYVFNRDTWFGFSTSLTAHEIGHNLDGRHFASINCGPSTINPNRTGSIMCMTQQHDANPYYFSNQNETRINNHITNNGTCLSNVFCQENITLNAVSINSDMTFQRINSLETNGNVIITGSDSNLTVKVDDTVTFNSGFRVELGSELRVETNNCP